MKICGICQKSENFFVDRTKQVVPGINNKLVPDGSRSERRNDFTIALNPLYSSPMVPLIRQDPFNISANSLSHFGARTQPVLVGELFVTVEELPNQQLIKEPVYKKVMIPGMPRFLWIRQFLWRLFQATES